jgi:hypothetical protein
MRAAALGLCVAILLVLVLVALLALALPVLAHDHWISQNAETSWRCNEKDCRMLGEGEAVQTPAGWAVNGRPIASRHVYPVTSAVPAEAARFHACFYGDGTPRCLFVPALF